MRHPLGREIDEILQQPDFEHRLLIDHWEHLWPDVSKDRLRLLSNAFYFFFLFSFMGSLLFAFYLFTYSLGRPKGMLLVALVVGGVIQLIPLYFCFISRSQRVSAYQLRKECQQLEYSIRDEHDDRIRNS